MVDFDKVNVSWEGSIVIQFLINCSKSTIKIISMDFVLASLLWTLSMWFFIELLVSIEGNNLFLLLYLERKSK